MRVRTVAQEHTYYEYWRERLSGLFSGHILQYAAHTYPDRVALMIPCDDSSIERITYQQLFDDAMRVSAYLTSLGLAPRDRIVMIIENSIDFYRIYYGAWQIGMVVVPVNTFLTATEISAIVRDADPRIIIAHRRYLDYCSGEGIACMMWALDEAIPQVQQIPVPLVALDPDECAIMLYTSGTTGVPKGVMLSSAAIVENIIQVLARLEYTSAERLLCPLPLFHSFTQNTSVWASMFAGVTVILLPKITRSLLYSALSCGPTIVLGIPTLYALFAKLPKLDFSRVRYCICGGEALMANIQRYFMLRYGRTIVVGYGLTEAGPVVSVAITDHLQPTTIVGPPLQGITCELRDCTDEGIGVLWIRGANLMKGYAHAPEATAKVLVDGWLNTGDMATITDSHGIAICGREKELIVYKGIKIYPQEIEAVLATHSGVAMVAVIAASYEEGERPVAFVQCMSGALVTIDQLQEYCSLRLAAYKVPHRILLVTTMPLTTTGKIDKKRLSIDG